MKFFDAVKGWGFVTLEEPDHGDVFLHINEVPTGETPVAGDRLEFTVEKGPKGLKARNARRAP